MNKNQFMHILQQELKSLGPSAVTEILADFEEHFANGLARGKNEPEITAELGDPLEIARQYIESAAESGSSRPTPTIRYMHPDSLASSAPASVSAPASMAAAAGAALAGAGPSAAAAGSAAPVQTSARKVNESALVAVVLFNILLGIPIWIGLYGTLFGFWVAAGGIGVAACVLFTVAILKAGVTSLILVLFGLALTALTILAVILMVYLTKWLCIGLGHYIRWNKKLVVGGGLT